MTSSKYHTSRQVTTFMWQIFFVIPFPGIYSHSYTSERTLNSSPGENGSLSNIAKRSKLNFFLVTSVQFWWISIVELLHAYGGKFLFSWVISISIQLVLGCILGYKKENNFLEKIKNGLSEPLSLKFWAFIAFPVIMIATVCRIYSDKEHHAQIGSWTRGLKVLLTEHEKLHVLFNLKIEVSRK